MDTIKQAEYHHYGGILPFAILFPLCYTEEDHAA